MLNDEAASLRISGSPVHKRASKPNLGDLNPSIAAIAKYDRLYCFCSNSDVCTTMFWHVNIVLLVDRRYAWDWLAILLLMVVLVITEKMKPFEKSIYHEDNSVSLDWPEHAAPPHT